MNKEENWDESLDDILSNSNVEDLEFEEMVINSDFVATILELMEKHKIKTRKELASRLGLSKAYITKVFSSDKNINLNFLARLQRVFNVSFQLTTSDILNQLKSKQENTRVVYVFSEYHKVLIKGYLPNAVYEEGNKMSIDVSDIGKLKLDYKLAVQ